jgi:hypothetical protein
MHARRRFFIALVLGSCFALMFLATLAWHDWIEILFGVTPDSGSGALEWSILLGLGLIAIGSLTLAGLDWRRTRMSPQAPSIADKATTS